jgi:hypothetical protein
VVNVMCVDLDALAFILHFARQLCIASKLLCSLREAMAGYYCWVVYDVISGKIGRSAVNRR